MNVSELYTEKIAFSQSCINTIKEFASYIWDPKAGDRGEDKPGNRTASEIQAYRYGIAGIWIRTVNGI